MDGSNVYSQVSALLDREGSIPAPIAESSKLQWNVPPSPASPGLIFGLSDRLIGATASPLPPACQWKRNNDG